jgi:hypothetical protein
MNLDHAIDQGIDYAEHSEFSDPGRHAALVRAVPLDTASLHRAATATVLHYRAGEVPPTPAQLDDIDRRWVASTLDAAVERAGGPLDSPRAPADRVGGCCRDHSLLAISILREHGVPARSRVGFAGYFRDGYLLDHVVVERWSADAGRWVRFDPELSADAVDGTAHDLRTGPGAPFVTAAEAWTTYRAGRSDLLDHCAMPETPGLSGPGFVQWYVLMELAHRMRCETLLWDVWGAAERFVLRPDGPPQRPVADAVELTDRVAALLLASDAGDESAEAELRTLWHERLRPREQLRTLSPAGRAGTTNLTNRTTTWRGNAAVGP